MIPERCLDPAPKAQPLHSDPPRSRENKCLRKELKAACHNVGQPVTEKSINTVGIGMPNMFGIQVAKTCLITLRQRRIKKKKMMKKERKKERKRKERKKD